MPKADVNCTLLSNPVEEGMKKQTETDRKPSKILTNFGIAFRVNFEVFYMFCNIWLSILEQTFSI